MIYQHQLRYLTPGNTRSEYFKKWMKPGDFHIFSASLGEGYAEGYGDEKWRKVLQYLGLYDKIVYQSVPAFNYNHSAREFPSIFIIICKS